MPRCLGSRVRRALNLPEVAAAGPPDPRARDQAPARYGGTEGCRWCGGLVVRPRRTFCGEACVHAYRMRSSAGYRRAALFEARGPMCEICSVDTCVIGAALRRSPERARAEYSLSRARVSRPRRLRGAVFDADHIIPVFQGGGGCGLENLRLRGVPRGRLVGRAAARQVKCEQTPISISSTRWGTRRCCTPAGTRCWWRC